MRQMVEEQTTNMNLSAVRLCFQAYLPDESGCFTKALPPCISDPVYDSSKVILNVAYSYMDTVKCLQILLILLYPIRQLMFEFIVSALLGCY